MRAPSSAVSLLPPRLSSVIAVRCRRAPQRWDAEEDRRPDPLRLRQVIAVRCAMAGNSKAAPAGVMVVPVRSKLVIHVLSHRARAKILQPASLKFDFSRISSFVSVGSLLSMHLSSCGGRSRSLLICGLGKFSY